MDQLMSSIMGWGPNWAPRSWALCQGQLLAISSNTALFSLLGTTYGGDGRTTFGLPDLRGRVPIGAGQGPGTSSWPLGAKAGSESQTLTQLEMPVHNHSAQLNNAAAQISASSANASTNEPSNTVVLAKANDGQGSINPGAIPIYADASGADTTLHPAPVSGSVLVSNAGGGQPFSVMQPTQVISWIIALQGVFPSRN
ncbi:MAG: phage tail protein [Alphaproteobacteria bacterium]|jgi:microcystin-dependent protein|nr:phage tail protein [Alphaproteobacteria bacterium]